MWEYADAETLLRMIFRFRTYRSLQPADLCEAALNFIYPFRKTVQRIGRGIVLEHPERKVGINNKNVRTVVAVYADSFCTIA